MKFKQFLNEYKFAVKRVYDDSVVKDQEKENAKIFLSKYNGNIFKIETKKNTVEFVWSIHAMSRFIERNINPKNMQSLLEKVTDDFVEYPENKKFLVFSKSLNQGFVISKVNKNKINILTVYPVGEHKTNKTTTLVLIENEEIQVDCFYYD